MTISRPAPPDILSPEHAHDPYETYRVLLEHYLPDMTCEWCHQGEYRHCEATDWHTNPNAIRYGYTSADVAPHLWGGFAHYLFAPWNAIVHKVPDNVTPELAGIATPLANGIQWALFEAGIGYGSVVLIQGPGQQGLAQIVSCKQAGADCIIITGTSKDSPAEKAGLVAGDMIVDRGDRLGWYDGRIGGGLSVHRDRVRIHLNLLVGRGETQLRA